MKHDLHGKRVYDKKTRRKGRITHVYGGPDTLGLSYLKIDVTLDGDEHGDSRFRDEIDILPES